MCFVRLLFGAAVVFLAGCADQDVVSHPNAASHAEVKKPAIPFIQKATRRSPVAPKAELLVKAARDRLKASVVYDGRYVGLDYPGGDVPATMGVCTDVVIRSYRKAHGFDLQKAVHEDIKANFSKYPTTWGHQRPDKNIDHRRVPNLEVWFTRAGHAVPLTHSATDYRPGDIVSWRLDGRSGEDGLPHIGIVSDRRGRDGTPLIIHNIGRGPEESNMLFDHTITGHFRYFPASS